MAGYDMAMGRALDGLRSAGSRREFLRLAGLVGGTLALAACDDDDNPVQPGGNGLTLDFTKAVDVLTYAYGLEALEADFYTKVAANASFSTAFSDAAERQLLTDVRDHEVAHREFLKAAIAANGGTAPALTTTYPASVNFANRTSVLATAKTFEDLGVSAYNGAAKYLTSHTDLLTIAGKIVSVEARHASAIRDLISPNTDAFANVSDISGVAALGADESQGLDGLLRPTEVLNRAQPYIVQTITVTGS